MPVALVLVVVASVTAIYSVAYLTFAGRFGVNRVSLWLTALDVAVVSVAILRSGGFESSAYLLFFLEAIGIAMFGSVALTVGYGASIIAIYCLLTVHDLVSPGAWWSFAFRAATLLLTSLSAGVLGAAAIRQWRALARQATEERITAQREQAVSRVAKALTSELDHERVLDMVLQSAVSILGASAGWVTVTQSGTGERIVSVANLSSELIGSEAPADAGVKALADAFPLQDHEFACSFEAPITVGSERIGALALFGREEKACGLEEQRLLRSLAELAAASYTNAQLFAERRLREQHLACLNAIGRKLVETMDIGETFEDIRRALADVLSADFFYVAAYDEAEQMVNILYLYDDGTVYPGARFPLDGGVTSRAIRERQIIHIDSSADYESIPGATWLGNDLRRTRSILAVPMMREERVVGVLSVQSYRLHAYDATHEQLVQTIANQVAVALENSRLYAQMRQLSLQDWLTGLGNARYFFRCMEQEISRAERYGHPLSLIMVDSDKLKAINDQFGHPVGDQHVIQLAEIIKSQTRQADVAIRYAGDEFLVVLPETDETSALITAERIRQSVEKQPIQVGGISVPVTVSLGVASYPRHGQTAEELFRSVDTALYNAKRSGKNHTSVFSAVRALDRPLPVV